jgi:hypothetical protein
MNMSFMSITSNAYVSQNVYCIQPLYYAESTRKKYVICPGNDTDRRDCRIRLLKKTNDKYIANTGGLRNFYSM